METEEISFDEILTDTGEGGATLFSIDGDEQWVPNSLITGLSHSRKVFEVPVWFAKKEGLV